MAKPWYAKTWGKSAKIIKDLLETYLELFSDKGDLNIVNALLVLKKLKSQDAIAALKKAIETRRYTARGIATPYSTLESRGSRVPLMQTIRNERARLDPTHEPAEIKGMQPWELPRTDPVTRRTVRVTQRSVKAPKEQTEANVSRGIEDLAVKTVGNFRAPTTVRAPSPSTSSSGFSLSNSEIASIPSLTPESNLGSPKPNSVSVPLPRGANTVKVSLGQGGGFSPTIMSSFVTNGMRLLPAAAYLGYKQIKRRTMKRR